MRIYTTEEIATILFVTVRTVRYYISKGYLEAKGTTSYKIHAKDLDIFFDEYFNSKRFSNKSRV